MCPIFRSAATRRCFLSADMSTHSKFLSASPAVSVESAVPSGESECAEDSARYNIRVHSWLRAKFLLS